MRLLASLLFAARSAALSATLLAGLLAACLAAFPAAAQTLSKTQKIERIIDLTQGAKAIQEIVAQASEIMQQAQPKPSVKQTQKRDEALKKIDKLLRDRFDKLRPEVVRIYSDAFSDDEIDGLLKFYETPAGRASIEKLPLVSQRIGSMMQTQIDSLSQEINKLAEDALKN